MKNTHKIIFLIFNSDWYDFFSASLRRPSCLPDSLSDSLFRFAFFLTGVVFFFEGKIEAQVALGKCYYTAHYFTIIVIISTQSAFLHGLPLPILCILFNQQIQFYKTQFYLDLLPTNWRNQNFILHCYELLWLTHIPLYNTSVGHGSSWEPYGIVFLKNSERFYVFS